MHTIPTIRFNTCYSVEVTCASVNTNMSLGPWEFKHNIHVWNNVIVFFFQKPFHIINRHKQKFEIPFLLQTVSMCYITFVGFTFAASIVFEVHRWMTKVHKVKIYIYIHCMHTIYTHTRICIDEHTCHRRRSRIFNLWFLKFTSRPPRQTMCWLTTVFPVYSLEIVRHLGYCVFVSYAINTRVVIMINDLGRRRSYYHDYRTIVVVINCGWETQSFRNHFQPSTMSD